MTVHDAADQTLGADTVVLVYITTPSHEVAETIANVVVERRLVACANILGAMTSIYRWNGALQRDSEVVLICKTVRSLVPALEAKVRSLHPYECPCVIALPVVAGSSQFLEWVNAQVTVDGPLIE
jgi:periplasmic divalent cation tolerance protein